MTYLACKPARALPICSALASCAQVRASSRQVCGWSLAKISVFVIVKSARRIPARGAAYQRASSVHRFARRFAALTDVAPTIGCGRVSRKFQPSQARRAVLPGPAQDFIAILGVCGKASNASRCQGSGLTPNRSSTIAYGFRFHAMRVSSDRSRSRLIRSHR